MSDQIDTETNEDARFQDRSKALSAARQSGKTERESHTCPKCGEEYKNLPAHLRACSGGGGQ